MRIPPFDQTCRTERRTALLPVVFLCVFLLCACTGYGWPNNTRPHTYAAALGDLDGDGDLDAFLANGRNEGIEPDTVWWNDGQGDFTNPLRQAYQAEKMHVALGDLDGDGDLDALVDAGSNIVALNDGRGKFTYLKHRYLYTESGGG
jgi:hypothetical protein